MVYDLKTFHSDRVLLYCFSLYRISEIFKKSDRDLTTEEYQKRKKYTIVFDGTDCFSKKLDWLVSLKVEARKVKIRL